MEGLLSAYVWLLALSVSMDTFAMSMSLGLRAGHVPERGYVRTAAAFAGMQTLFLWLGSLIGDAAAPFVGGTSWVVCVLLAGIGAWMIHEALEDEDEDEVDERAESEKTQLESEDLDRKLAAEMREYADRKAGNAADAAADERIVEQLSGEREAASLRVRSTFAWKVLLTLAVAESIDSLGIGATLGLGRTPMASYVIAVFAMTALSCVLGLLLGGKLGEKWKKGAGVLGGIILILLGVRQVIA